MTQEITISCIKKSKVAERTLLYLFPVNQSSNFQICRIQSEKDLYFPKTDFSCCIYHNSLICQSLYSNHTFTTLIDHFTSQRVSHLFVFEKQLIKFELLTPGTL